MASPSMSHLLIGQGTGSSTQGANFVGATSFKGFNSAGSYNGFIVGNRVFETAEGGLTKTWLELGILGVVLYGFIFLSVVLPTVRLLRRFDGTGRALTVLTVALGIIFLKNHQSLDDPLVQPLFWLSAGGAWGRIRSSSSRSLYTIYKSKGRDITRVSLHAPVRTVRSGPSQ